MAIAPREGFEDVALGFLASIYRVSVEEGKPSSYVGWPVKQSFPVFILNVCDYLGGRLDLIAAGNVPPGRPVSIEAPTPQARMSVRTPDGRKVGLKGSQAGKYSFADTADLGVYDVLSGGEPVQRFAVNLFDPTEGDVRPDPKPIIKIGYVEVEGKTGWEPARRETWKWLLLLGLAVLLFEWYIYNRRVYL
jgi:hypothetical protein